MRIELGVRQTPGVTELKNQCRNYSANPNHTTRLSYGTVQKKAPRQSGMANSTAPYGWLWKLAISVPSRVRRTFTGKSTALGSIHLATPRQENNVAAANARSAAFHFFHKCRRQRSRLTDRQLIMTTGSSPRNCAIPQMQQDRHVVRVHH